MSTGLMSSTSARPVSGEANLLALASKGPARGGLVSDSIGAGSTAAGKQSYGGMMERIAFASDGRIMNWFYPSTAAKTNAWESYSVSGSTVDGRQTQSYRWDPITNKCNLVFYWLGHNDMPSDGASLTNAQRNTLRNKVRADIETMSAAGAAVVPVPLIHTLSKERDEVVEHNAWLAEYCSAAGLVLGPDVFTVIDGNHATLTHDNTHPNDLGYLYLQRAFKSWINRYMPRSIGWHPLGSGTASQTAAVLNYAGSMTTGGLGTAGYGGTPGTFTSSVTNAEDAGPSSQFGLSSNALNIVKTGGQSMYAMTKSIGGMTGVSVGDLIMFHLRFKSTNMISGDSMIQTNFSCTSGHGAAYLPLYGGYETDGEWATLLTCYEVPASSSNVNFEVFIRPQTTASTSTTCNFSLAEPYLFNLTTGKVDVLWGF